MGLGSPGVVQQLTRWLAPTAPESIRAEVERRQLVRIREHVPMLYMIGTLNTLILMAVCAQTGIAPRYYLWMSGLIVLAVVRTVMWSRTKQGALAPAAVSSLLKRSAWVATATLLVTGAFTTYTFVSGAFFRSTLIPISLAFGSMSIAHCFAPLRPSAVAALTLGIIPSAAAMILVGNFDAQVLGLSMLTIALLMIHFVAGQYDQLLTEVQLQREVHDLANTDALTGLANRRAVVAMVEKELALGTGNTFGVALLDLDGFKGINDRLGHLAGDALLRVVGQRLNTSRAVTDTVGRLGGDEFIVVFRAIQGAPDVPARSAAMLAELCRTTEIAGEMVMVRASLGASTFPQNGHTTAALLAAADDALYANKRERTAVQATVEAEAPEERRRHRTS